MANRYVESWLRQAEHELEAARQNLGLAGHDTCVVLCQQAVEKALNSGDTILNYWANPKFNAHRTRVQ